MTGRPVAKIRPEDPPEEPAPEDTTSPGTMITAIAIVLIAGFVGWKWFVVYNAQYTVSPVYLAAKSVERNLDLRRKRPQLSGSVERFRTEIAAAREQDPSDGEAEALDYYDEAVVVLNDSLTLWAAKEEHGPDLSPDVEGVAPLREKYFLPVDDTDNVKADESLEIIWLKAEESLHAGNGFYTP